MQRSSKTQRSAKKKPQRNNNYQHNKNKSTASAVLFLYDIDMDIFQAYNISNIIKGENEVKKHLISICIFLILIISLGIVFTSCGSSKVAKFGRYSGQNIARKLENEGFNVDVIDEDSLISICVDLGDYSVVTVPTDSMEPTFAKGDVIVAKTFKGDISSLKVGQVITFKSQIRIGNAYYESFNTHRIIQITSSGIIYTRGDNQNKKDGQDWKEYIDNHDGTITESVSVSDVVAVWGDVDAELNFTPGKVLKGAGLMSNWLHDPEKGRTRFFCVIVLPLILLFVAYAFVLVRTLIIAKLEKDKETKADTTVTVDSLSDEEKRRLAEEYLASLAAQNAAQSGGDQPAEEAPAEEPAPAEQPAEEPAPQEEPADELPSEDSSENK